VVVFYGICEQGEICLNICGYFAAEQFFMVMEFAPHGSLKTFLMKAEPAVITSKVLLQMAATEVVYSACTHRT